MITIGSAINLIIVQFKDQRLIFDEVRKIEDLRHHSTSVVKRIRWRLAELHVTSTVSEIKTWSI